MSKQSTVMVTERSRKGLSLIVLTFTSLAIAEPATLTYDPNSPAALEARAKYEAYDKDGQALLTAKLSAELDRLKVTKANRMALVTEPSEILEAAFKMTNDDMRAISYASVLQKRSDSGEPLAAFFNSVQHWDFCLQQQKQQGEIWVSRARECWQGVMSGFKRASEAQIGDASFNIGKMYEEGFGVLPSKLVAAEWYVKSAEQYNKTKSRAEALTAVERAVNLVPDHPAALRLRRSMLK